MRGLLAAALFLAPAPAALALEGRVVYDGCPVTHALVTIKGKAVAREVFAPLGRFSVEGLPRGSYEVSAKVTFGLNAALEAGPVRAGEDGRVDLPVRTSAAPSPAGRYSGTVRFRGGAAPDLCERPLFIGAKAIDAPAPAYLARVRPVPGDPRAGTFALDVAPGRAYVLQTQSGFWGPVRAVPQTDEIVPGSAPVRVELDVVPSGDVHVDVLGPDGKPYRPDFSRDYLDVRLTPDAMCFDRQVKPDGTLDLLGVPPGRYYGEVFGRGPGADWAAPPFEVVVEEGRTSRLRLSLAKAVDVALASAPLPAGVPEDRFAAKRSFDGRERWIRALPAGAALDRDAAARLMLREGHGPFQLRAVGPGLWRAPESDRDNRARAIPGGYDVYLIETAIGWSETAYLRLVASLPAWRAAAGSPAALSFAGTQAVWGGRTLSGELRGVPAPSDTQLDALGADYLRFLARHAWLAVRDARGRPVAFAWPRPSAVPPDEALVLVTDALSTRRYGPLRERLAASRHAFAVPDLPDGDYEVEAGAWDCPPVRARAKLGPGAPPLKLELRCVP